MEKPRDSESSTDCERFEELLSKVIQSGIYGISPKDRGFMSDHATYCQSTTHNTIAIAAFADD